VRAVSVNVSSSIAMSSGAALDHPEPCQHARMWRWNEATLAVREAVLVLRILHV